MAIVDTINNIKEHLGEAYASLEEKGATIPENKNIENLADSILSIKSGDIPSRLPKEYQEVEYIESTGNQYISTGIDASICNELEFGFIPIVDYSGYQSYLAGNLDNFTVGATNHITGMYLRTNGVEAYSSNYILSKSEKNILKIVNTNININGETRTFSGNLGTGIIHIFTNASKSRNSAMKFYSLKLKGETFEREFVPCYRKEDNVIGLYELKENIFYMNQGTGTFLKGDNVGKYEEKEVEITENGISEITPSEGYNSMSKVTVTTNVGGSIEEYFTLYPQTAAPSSQSNGLKNYVKRVPKLNLSSATSMAYLYANMPLVEEIDCSFDTTTIKDMQYCFYADTKLKNIKGIENWNTSNVTNMKYLLYNCYKIEMPLDLKKWDTSNVTTMEYMFAGVAKDSSNGCELDLSTWNTSKVTAMNYFFGASTSSSSAKIKSVKFPQNFGEACTNFNNFFSYISPKEPIQLDLSMWNVSKATSMTQMFRYFNRLSVLDISSFDFTNVASYSQIFNYCGSSATVETGAYANGIPYIYVKDAAAQQWILNLTGMARPSSWTVNNVIIAGSEQDLRGA